MWVEGGLLLTVKHTFQILRNMTFSKMNPGFIAQIPKQFVTCYCILRYEIEMRIALFSYVTSFRFRCGKATLPLA